MSIGIFSLIVLIFSVVIHEVSHGLAARALGDKTAEYEGRLTLNPIKHIDPFGSVILPLVLYLTGSSFLVGYAKPVPYNPYNFDFKWRQWGDALVAAAGPASNILIALIFAGIFRLLPYFDISSSLIYSAAPLIVSIIITNVTLALFNMVPVPPLDGSKILFALIPYQYREITHKIERYSLPLALIAMFIVWPLISPIVFSFALILIGQ